MALDPCSDASDYTDGTAISFGGTAGFMYSPNCLRVHVGATVTFSEDFSSHPLHASTRGTAGNPILAVSSGASHTVAFSSAGFFPFYCTFHGGNSGSGMSGVVQVVP